jgi:hypothetical protein
MLLTTHTQLLPLRTSRLPVSREGDPFVPKAYTPVLLRTDAGSHMKNRNELQRLLLIEQSRFVGHRGSPILDLQE